MQAPRLPGLDLIRAFAIVWVTVYHAMTFGLVPDPDGWFVAFGWMGVDLFFVLSGYLIAGRLLRALAAGEIDYAGFFRLRALRTLPAYAVVVAIYFLVPAARERPDIQPFWQFATFTENLLIDLRTPKAFSHVWSLCVEEQFYLLFPAVLALVAIRPSCRRTYGVMAAVLLSGMIVRGVFWLTQVVETPFDVTSAIRPRPYMTLIYYPTWSRLDGLLAGVAAAADESFRPALWRRLTTRPNLLVAIGLCGIAGSIRLFGDQIAGLWAAIFGFPLLACSMTFVVIGSSRPRALVGRRAWPGVSMLAAGAYSLYLGQKIAFHLVTVEPIASVPIDPPMRFVISLLVVGVVGGVLYHAVERPCLVWRDHLDRKRPGRFAPNPGSV